MSNFEHKEGMCNLISVVVPVYNVEKYLEKCVNSLLSQTYKDIEIILVNDGSTDSSLSICQEYERLDERVKVLCKENGGLSSARNMGIKSATGKYIAFVDSDDYVSKYYIETLVQNASDNSISIVSHRKVHENDSVIESVFQRKKPRVLDKKGIFKLFFSDNNMSSAWGKLFPASFFKRVVFPEGRIYEDFATIYKLYDQATVFYFYDNELYNYLMRNSSITNSSFSKKNFDLLSACDEVELFIKENKLDYLQDYFADRKVRSYLILIGKLMNSQNKCEYKEEAAVIRNYLRNIDTGLFFTNRVALKTRLGLFIYIISPNLWCFLLNRKRK